MKNQAPHSDTHTFNATIENSGYIKLQHREHACNGIGASEFPSPEVGYRYVVTIKKLGADPAIKPELHSFMPKSNFGGWIDSEGSAAIREARQRLKCARQYDRAWWKKRLALLLEDRDVEKRAKKQHATALRHWKADCKKAKCA